MDYAHLLFVNARDGSSVHMEWNPPAIRDVFPDLKLGRASEEDIKSKIPESQVLAIDKLVKGKVPEVLGSLTGPFVLAPKLRDFIEEIEPGVHRFSSVRIKTFKPVNGTTDHGTHWLLFSPRGSIVSICRRRS